MPGLQIVEERVRVIGQWFPLGEFDARFDGAEPFAVIRLPDTLAANSRNGWVIVPRKGGAVRTVRQRPDQRNYRQQAEWQEPTADSWGNQRRSRIMLLASSTEAVQVGGTTVVESYSSMTSGPGSERPARLGRLTTGVSAQPRPGPK